MDFLRLVLIRLPLRRFVELTEVLPKPRNLIASRMKVVNRSDDGISVETMSDYVKICEYQGELNPFGPIVIHEDFLATRAAFLQDADSYHEFTILRRSRIYPDIALRSQVPEIQNSELDWFSQDSRILDPEAVPWTKSLKPDLQGGSDSWSSTKSLRADFLSRILPFGTHQGFLTGYLLYPDPLPGRLKTLPILEGYIKAAMKSANPFIPHPIIDALIPDIYAKVQGDLHALREILLRNGYYTLFFLSDTPIGLIFAYIQPVLFEHYIGNKSVRGAAKAVSAKSIGQGVAATLTEDLVRRAGQMLKWSELFSPYYRCFLQILVGREVDLTTVGRKEVFPLFTLMYRVAHPQLTRELMNTYRSSLHRVRYEPSYVAYDVVNFVRICLERIPSELTDEWCKLEVLIARGQLWKLRGTPIFEIITVRKKWIR